MKRKDYLKPTMKVVKLQHQSHLLQVSGEVQGRSSVQDYDVNRIDE